MKPRSAYRLIALFLLTALGIAARCASASPLSGATGSHDPSRILLCNGKYYVYSTGGGMKCSIDGVNWTAGPSPFPPAGAGGRPGRAAPPASAVALVPDHRGIWAPDIIFYRDKYYLYYSVASPLTVGKCVIGLLTSPTLDPSAPGYQWTDAGVVIATEDKVEKKSAIDPGPFVDGKGDLWLVWGSGYANGATWDDPTIVISKLDNATGLRSKEDTKIYPVAPGHIEAGYVHYHAGHYYAFWNDGGCCNGVNSSYRIHVSRSSAVTGPYANKAGKEGGGEIFMVSDKEKDIHGPGHMGIESEPGLDRFSFHYYNANARPVLGERTLVWGADGWPTVGEDLVPGTYKITAANGLALSVRGDSAADGAAIELQPYTGSPSQKWVVAYTPEGYCQLSSVGSGKFIETGAPAADVKSAAATIDQVAADPGSRQHWIVDLTSDGKDFRLQSGANHEVMSFPAAAAETREKSVVLTTTAWSNLPAQKWDFSAP